MYQNLAVNIFDKFLTTFIMALSVQIKLISFNFKITIQSRQTLNKIEMTRQSYLF